MEHIAASEAKAKFSELLERVQKGETISITLHGVETAKLVPAKKMTNEQVRAVIARMKANRSRLNPPGKSKLLIKDLINTGRP